MPPAVNLRGVIERGPVVQDPAVVDEVHVPRLQVELRPQVRPVEELVEHAKGRLLARAQRLASLLVPDLDPVTQVAEVQLAPTPADDRELNRRRLPGPDAAAAVDVERLIQGLEDVRAAGQ